MIKKIAYIGVIGLLISSIASCEKDFTEVGSTIINNGAFKAKDTLLEISMNSENIDAVRADNLALGILGEYWLGVYNNPNYKKIEASIVGQLGFIKNPRTEQKNTTDDIDSIYTLDKVLLKIPYQATKSTTKTPDGDPVFKLNSVLGNDDVAVSLKVLRNDTYLGNSFDPKNTSKANKFLSNFNYTSTDNLTENGSFDFKPKATDIKYVINRTKIINNAPQTFKDTIKIINSKSKQIEKPFLVVPLDKNKMKSLFWDKFGEAEFSSKDAFNVYFKGLIIKAEGNDGAMVPLSFSGTNNSPTLDFYYTITRREKKAGQTTKVHKDTIVGNYSFPLSGVRNSMYKMTNNSSTPSNSVAIQGTAGSTSKITILGGTQLQDLRTKKWLINDASLTFYVNQTVDNDTTTVPQRLLLYKNLQTSEGLIATQISDSYKESTSFGGGLKISEKKPEKYTFRITDYITEILKGNEPVSPLTLKVYNPTDASIKNRSLDTIVKTYNWNPRGVTLLNNLSSNGEKKAVLKISYTEEK